MKLRILFFICFLSNSVLAQNRIVTNYYRYGENDYESKIESIESFDNNGNLSGLWTKFFRNGQVYIKGAYKNGKKEGVWKIYDKQYIVYLGQDSDAKSILKQEIGYKNGRYHGVYKKYKILKKFKNSESEYNSKYKNYEGEDAIDHAFEKIIGRYTNGKKSGEWIYHSDDLIEDTEENGTYYNHRLAVDSIGNYRNGVKNGKWQYYSAKDYGKATLDSTGIYLNGLQNGVWSYYKYGKVIRQGAYTEGVRSGNWEIFHYVSVDSVVLSKSGTYINDKKEGNWKYYLRDYYYPPKVWDESSQDSVEQHKGRFQWKFKWNIDNYTIQNWKDGKKEGFWKEIGIIENYYGNNEDVKFSGHYTNGLKNGVWLTYNESNDLLDSGNYVSGKKQGFWKVDQTQGYYVAGIKEGDWFEEGFRGTYHNDLREGLWTKEDADGNKAQGSFKAGVKYGNWNFIYKNWDGELESQWEGNFWNGYPIEKWKNSKKDEGFSVYSIDLDTTDNAIKDEMTVYLLTEEFYGNKQLKQRIEGNVIFERDSSLAPPEFDAYEYDKFIEDEEKNVELKGYSSNRYTENGELDSRNNYTVTKADYDDGLLVDPKLEKFQILEVDLDSIINRKAKRKYVNGAVKYTLEKLKVGKTRNLTVYYPNGAIYLTGSIKNNMSVDNWAYYYQNGKIKERGVRADTLIIEEYWDDFERMQTIDSVHLRLRNGIWEFYDVSGQLKLREYKLSDPNEDFEGLRTERMIYEWIRQPLTDEVTSGSISSTGSIVNAKKVGVWKYYTIEGIKELEGEYNQDGVKIGEWRAYNYQGELAAIRSYDKNGKKHGVQFVNMYQAAAGNWFKDSINYKHGIVQYPDGNYEADEYEDMITGTYKNNLKVGKWVKHSEFEDIPTEIIVYDKKGKILDRKRLLISEEDTTLLATDLFDYSSKILTSINYKSNGDTLYFSIYKLPKKKVSQDYQYKSSLNLLLTKGFYGKTNIVTNKTIKNGNEFIDYKFNDKGILLYETKYGLGPLENKIINQEKSFFENGSIKQLLIPEVLE